MASNSSSNSPTTSRRSIARVLELIIYAGIVGIVLSRIPLVCSPLWLNECQATPACRRFLREGWLGPTLDVADDQWRELRESLPLLFAVAAAHGLVGIVVRKTCPRDDLQDAAVRSMQPMTDSSNASNAAATEATPPSASPPAAAFLPMGELGRRRALLNAAVSASFLAVLHGAHAAFPLSLVCGAFAVGHALKGTRLAQPATWALAVSLIWLKERWYRALTFEKVLGEGFAALDKFQGLHPWRLSFNLAVLRIVSFNVDLHWAELRRKGRAADLVMPVPSTGEHDTSGDKREKDRAAKHMVMMDAHEYSARVSAHRPAADYSLWHCLCYAFYSPLYLAGPTLTFNAFVSHMASPQRSYGRRRLLFYFARLLLALLLLEWGLHRLPVFALARSGSLSFRPEILGLFVYSILLIMWFKFLVIWRLFRLWALCDGVEPPENMQKCMSNNYSVVGFWKGWHCSFNRWLVRYLYIPLGGAKAGRRWNVFVVFAFVAFWHDLEPKLFMWGMLNGVFLVLEMAVKGLYRRSSALEGIRANPVVNRTTQVLGATLNVMALLLVNMIGYAVGIKGAGNVAGGIFLVLDREGLLAVAYSLVFLFSAVQLMFAIEEARQRGKTTRTASGYSSMKANKA